MAKQNWFQKMLANAVGKSLSIPFAISMTQRFAGYGGNLSKNYLAEYKNWVFACVQARSEEVGNIDLYLKKDGQRVDDHEILDLIYKVNPHMTKAQLFTATQAFKDLDGNAYWYLARDGVNHDGQIREIYVLRPDKVIIVPNKDNPLDVEGYVFVQPDGKRIPFDKNEILHFKTFNPLGYHPFPHKGMGIVEASQWSIETDNEARKWNYAFFKNSARPDGLLLTAGEAGIDEAEFKRIQAEWQSEHQGSENNGKVAVLSGGVKWQDISRSQKEMDFMGQRTFSRDEILALFRVPKSILGITDDVNRANADASIYVFAKRTVQPLMQQMVDALNEMLLPEFKGAEGLEFDFTSPVPEDEAAKTAEFTAGLNKWYSRNEIRALKGLPPTTNGDQIIGSIADTEVDTAPRPESMKANRRTTVKETKVKNGKTKKATEKKTVGAEVVEKFIAKMPKAKQTFTKATPESKGFTPEQKAKFVEMWKAHLKISAAPLAKSLKAFFNDQKKEVIANVRSELKAAKKAQTKANAKNIVFDTNKAVKASISLITPYLKDYIQRSGSSATQAVGSDSFDPETTKIQNWIEERAQYFAESINGTTREDLLSSIQEGLDSDESMDDIEQRVADVYDIATGSRTATITKTEVAAASNAGNVAAYEQAGIEKHEWVVVNPEDEDCKENDGAVVEIGDAFPDGDIYPPVHPNCQCTTVPVFD